MLTENVKASVESSWLRRRLARMLRIEWLGQTLASLFWIASVFAYEVSSVGDWLQLCAASAWLVANIAAISTNEAG